MATITQLSETVSSQSIHNDSSSGKFVPEALVDKLQKGGVNPDRIWRHGERPNIALWVTKDHRIYQEEIPYPVCGPNNCIVHVRATGICGSEIHFWKTGRIGDCMVDHDLILGHESAGEILEVGANVTNFKRGDRVSIEPGVTCWECKQCLSGRYNLCPDVKFSGTPPSHGTMARYISHPARFLHRIPDAMSYAHGALVEPLSVAVGAIGRCQPKLGQPVLVCGAGPIGLAVAIAARAAGAHPVLITDLEESRLTQANQLGFNLTLKIDLTWDRFETVKRIRDVFGSECRPELAFECTGAQSSIVSAFYALVEGGTLVQIGHGKPEIELPVMAMTFREVNVINSFRYKQTWPTVIRLLNDNILAEATKLITHTFPLEQTIDAFQTCVTRDSKSIKVQIVDN
ncbi:putative xylitol dehydrogenase [Dendrothele bispora CBS 962.96]|uniref:Putative xylitol dehydrogenase n=1 Tax=Dendrothele bispora (strain CBS 962.96) TaxID=1314807 RepID=A0A4S8MR23_DENBC|nr:putative xylitol dehydrogenase [Dendrothele bispora CBS 962.96]